MFHDPSRRRLLGLAAGGAVAATLPGCNLPVRHAAVSRGQANSATVLGVLNERYRPGASDDGLTREVLDAVERRRRVLGLRPGQEMPPLQLLAVSGGGDNGAFGAGLLNGWTARGDRPVFDLVTGVSTGALTAPFAFLGPAWDDALRRVYTEVTLADVLVQRSLLAFVFNDGMADTTPLFHMISRELDERMMVELGKAYDDGRLLLIGTTDLDAQMPVVWNIGAIAKSGHPRALETIRRILLASAAIPGAFPPVLFDVTVNGEQRQELHVDGGAIAQTFLYPSAVTAQRRARMQRGQRVAPGHAYVIRNARLDPEWASVERRSYSIAGRAISTMIAASGVNDVMRIWNNARRDGIEYNLAFIGSDFTMEYTTPFNQAYMRALYQYGFDKARMGYPWSHQPPF